MTTATKPRLFTVDQLRTRTLERQGLRNATVSSDGLRATIELDLCDVDEVIEPAVPRCDGCGLGAATYCHACTTTPLGAAG